MESTPLIKQKKFSGFFWTQFLGAFNDNAFKQSIVFMLTFKLTTALPKETADLYVNLGSGLFILPYILFSTYAATWADRWGKSRVIVATKILEIGIMALGFYGYLVLDPQSPQLSINILLVTLFLMGTQSALFGPSKYGILPEILKDHELTNGNGLLEMGTFVSILFGTFIGGWLVIVMGDTPYFMSVIFIGIALSGWLTSLRIPKTKPVNPTLKFDLKFHKQIWTDYQKMRKSRVIFLTIMGISVFWLFGVAFLQLLLGFGPHVGASSMQTNVMTAVFSVGIGAGSLLCDKLSDGKVEMGLIPFGVLGMTVFSILLGYATPMQVTAWSDLFWVYFHLMGLGLFSGFFIVPLNALLQQRPSDEDRASMIGLNNVINAVFMVAASGFVLVGRSILGLNEAQLVQVMGLLLIFGAAYVCYLLPEFLIRFILWLVTNTIYRITTLHRERIPLTGGALIVANHLSYLDAFLVQMATHRHIRFVMDKSIYHLPVVHSFFKMMGAIPIYSRRHGEKYEAAFAKIKDALEQGEIVCIFPEGQITRTGQTFKFKEGMERILQETPCPVIPIFLHGIWGSVLSYKGERFFGKSPLYFHTPITVTVGNPLPPTTTAFEAREATLALSVEHYETRKSNQMLLHEKVLQRAKKYPFQPCFKNEQGRWVTYLRVCLEAKSIAKKIQSQFADSTIGIALPNSVDAVVLNLALALCGKVSVNINTQFSNEQQAKVLKDCQIKTVITTEALAQKHQGAHTCQWIAFSFLKERFGWKQRFQATLNLFTMPVCKQSLSKGALDQTFTIIYTPGTRGEPKGVCWSQHNLIANLEGFLQLTLADTKGKMISTLPFFHAYGLNVSCWLPLLAGIPTIFSQNNDLPEALVALIKKEKAQHLVSAPDLLAMLAEKQLPLSSKTLKYVIYGGKSLSNDMVEFFVNTWNVEMLQGYGTAECSPLVALNVPSASSHNYQQIGNRQGSLGRPIPGILIKILHPETQEPCALGETGVLWVGGPSITKGYIQSSKEDSELLKEGWFCTEDRVSMDANGFLFLAKNQM